MLLRDKKRGIFMNNVQQQSVLPSGYTRLKCLLLYAGQYFDTGIPLTSEDSMWIDMELDPNISESYAIMGCRDAFSTKNITISKQAAGYGLCVDFNNGDGNTYRYNNDSYAKGRYKIFCNKTSRGIEGLGSNNTACTDTFTTSANCYVGYWGAGYSSYACIGAVYGACIEGKWNGIPCYRDTDLIFGFYDTVSQSFFTNKGIGVPSGVLLNPPSGYKQLTHIKVEGTQWFDTGYTSTGKIRIDMCCRPKALTATESQVWCGAYNSNNSKNFYMGPGGSGNYDIYFKYYSQSDLRIAYAQATYSEIKAITAGGAGVAGLWVFPNTASTTYNAATNDQGISMYMFCRHVNTNISNIPAKIDEFYISRIQDNTVTKRLYLPFKRESDSVAGCYDLKNNQFKTSMTGTNFGAGSEIS